MTDVRLQEKASGMKYELKLRKRVPDHTSPLPKATRNEALQ